MKICEIRRYIDKWPKERLFEFGLNKPGYINLIYKHDLVDEDEMLIMDKRYPIKFNGNTSIS